MSVHREVEHLVYLSLGSNIQPELNLPRAVKLIGEKTQVLACSTAWQTEAVGGGGPDFLNAVLLIRADRPLEELKDKVIDQIEAVLGRVRTEDKNAPRTIDIDILVFDGVVLDTGIWTLAHLAIPLSEVYRGQIYSSSGESLNETCYQLSQTNPIEPHPDILRPQIFT